MAAPDLTLRIALAAALVCACSGSDGDDTGGAADGSRPHVVLITLDTLRPDRTGPGGLDGAGTPWLDSLAERGAVFERAFSTSSWTAPSTASIFTGLYPNGHGVIAGFRAHAKMDDSEGGVRMPGTKKTVHERMQLVQLPRSRPTLPEHFAQAGYATVGVATNLNIGTELGFDRGFDEFERLYLSPAEEVVAWVLDWRDLRTEAVAAGELEDRPYFMYLHLNDVHLPYDARPEHGYEPVKGVADDLARYDSEVRYLDHWLAELERGMGWADDDTVLMVVTDHGEEFRDHGRTGHRYSLYAELNDVLFQLAGAGVSPGLRVADHASLVDVLPTLLEAARLEVPAGLEGRSLLGLARGSGGGWGDGRPVYAHRIRGGSQEPVHERPPMLSVVAGGWKLIRNGEEDTVELYDLGADPRETKDLSEERPDVMAELGALLDEFAAREVRRDDGSDVEIDVDDELLRQLETLGYAGHE